MTAGMAQLRAARNETTGAAKACVAPAAQVEAAQASLNVATTAFAAQRMNARVQQALSGQRIDQIAA